MGRWCCRSLYTEVEVLKGVMEVAVLVVVAMLTMLAAAFCLNAYGIVSGRFDYPFDPAIIGLCQIVLSAAVTVLALGRYVEQEEEVFDAERIGTVEPGKVYLPAAMHDKAVADAEIVQDAAEKFDERTHLDHLFPGSWDGEISIREDKSNDQK